METLQLAENIIAGMLERQEIYLPYAQLDVVKWDKEDEIPIATVRALNGNQVQIEIDWHDKSYQDNQQVMDLIAEARKEVIVFLLF